MSLTTKKSFVARFTVLALVLAAIVVLLNAVAGSADLGRFDLTDDRIYTVSDAAASVLSELKVPVQVKLYMTRKDEMPTGLQTLERDVVDKLREFQVISGGNVQFTVIDPSEDESLKERIAEKNIRPFQVQSIERDAMGIKLVYAAMEILYLDKDPEVLPQVLPQSLDTFEYDVCSAIIKLTRDMDPVVAVHASKQRMDPQLMQLYMQMGQQPPPPQDLFGNVTQLLQSQSYEVRVTEITEESPIPEEAATLVILAPRDLTERQRYEINRFAQRGGNVVVATQKYEFNYTPSRQGGFSFTASPLESGIDPLLEAWGVRVSDDILMDANHEVLAVPSQRNVGGLRLQTSEPVQAPMQIGVTADQMVEGTSIANGLSQLLYLWGSRLELVEETLAEAGLQHGVLFTTSSDVWEVPYTPGPLPMSSLISDPDSELSREPLAVLVRGELPNAFAEGTVPSWSGAPDSVVTPVEDFVPVESSLVVVGCAKMFEDSFLTMVAGNALLLLNAVDALTLGDEIISIRARTMSQRTIDPLSDGAKLAYRFFVLAFVPLVVIAVGVFRWVRRRREEAVFLAAQRPAQA